MSGPARPTLIVSLPGATLDELRSQLRTAGAAGADAAEIRFDRALSLGPDDVVGLLAAPLPLLATLRSHAEGGAGPDTRNPRSEWVASAIAAGFPWIDLEPARDVRPARGRSDPAWVLSAHVSEAELLPLLRRTLREPVPAGEIAKVVGPSTVRTALLEIIPTVRTGRDLQRRCIMTTGPSGPLLRALVGRLGLGAVYCALPASASGPSVEAGQIPVDRLRRYLDGPPDSPLFAVVGSPILHSRSPGLHHRWMSSTGEYGLYVPLEIGAGGDLASVVPSLGSLGFRGLNVTHPLKREALALATSASPLAKRPGAANTLTFHDGQVAAENTDVHAVDARVRELRTSGQLVGTETLIVGTGGAAAAALAALEPLGGERWLLGRDAAAVARLTREFGARTADAANAHPVPLVIQATTVGRTVAGPLAMDLRPWLSPASLVLDFVYSPSDPVIRDLAAGAGARYEDGARLLIHAAARSFELWWKTTLPETDLAAAVEEFA